MSFTTKQQLQDAVSAWVNNRAGALAQYGDINTWDVSAITDMSFLFIGNSAFNSDISSWNVSNVTDMNHMFYQAISFNQPLNSWNVSKVTNMYFMFYNATAYNQNLSSWVVSSQTNVYGMFYLAEFMNARGAGSTPEYSYFNQASGPVISNTCFPAGTPILTNQGKIPIEKLQPHIHTIRNKTIVGITQTITPDKNLVCFEKDALGPNIPSEKTVVSKNHGIFYKGNMMKAKSFVGEFDNVYKVKYTGEVLYNVLMEEHDKMMVNNLICETLHPENSMAKIYMVLQKLSPKGQEELIRGCNEHIVKNKIFNSKQVTKKM